jgi:hypothetical protein
VLVYRDLHIDDATQVALSKTQSSPGGSKRSITLST